MSSSSDKPNTGHKTTITLLLRLSTEGGETWCGCFKIANICRQQQCESQLWERCFSVIMLSCDHSSTKGRLRTASHNPLLYTWVLTSSPFTMVTYSSVYVADKRKKVAFLCENATLTMDSSERAYAYGCAFSYQHLNFSNIDIEYDKYTLMAHDVYTDRQISLDFGLLIRQKLEMSPGVMMDIFVHSYTKWSIINNQRRKWKITHNCRQSLWVNSQETNKDLTNLLCLYACIRNLPISEHTVPCRTHTQTHRCRYAWTEFII